ncbi:hypothetical protein QE152_g30731 [Popillia japonica]|uniref:Uncharacterized protein n=1 Tax=Popillia japonica TaxID=7064 RepID=A0AAW1JDS2_POPJA
MLAFVKSLSFSIVSSPRVRQVNGNLITTVFWKGKLSRLDNLKSREETTTKERHPEQEGGSSLDGDVTRGMEEDGKIGNGRVPDEEKNDMGSAV